MQRNLRIALLSVHSSPLGRLGSADTGGMSVYLRELASELGRRGHRVDIFTRQTIHGWQQVIEYAPHVRVINLTVEGTEGLLRSELYEHLDRFCTVIDNFVRQKGGTYDLIHSNYWLSGVVGEQLKRLWSCPHIITFHTLAAVKMAALPGHVEDRNRIKEEERLLRHCNAVIVPTEEEGQYLASKITGEATSIYHIPWGVNMEHFKAADHGPVIPKTGDLEVRPLILFVGRFDPMKGIELAIRSICLLEKSNEIELVIIGGDGPASGSYKKIKELVNELGIDGQVQLIGPVEHSQMVLYYQKADVVVVSSRYESFGLVILEALASGTPVASTPVGISPHVIEQGTNGYLAAAGDDHSMAEAISRTLVLAQQQDAEKIRQSVSSFTWSRAVTSLLDVYKTMLFNT